jgi:PAS domain S-box-containing protein
VLGRSPDDLVGTSGFDPIHPDDTDRVIEDFAALRNQPGGRQTVEFRYQRPDGSWIWVETRGRNLLNTAVVDGIVIYTRDITEYKERERALQQERDRFRAVFDKAFDAMVLADDDGQFIDANRSATELFGLSKEELLERSIDEFAPDDFDFETVWDTFHQSDDERGTFPLVRSDGTERLVEYAATTNVVSGQHLSVLRDVTERDQRERELEQQTDQLEELTAQLKEQYQTLFEEAPMMMILTREEAGRPIIEDCTTQFAETLGYTKESLVDTDLTELYTPDSTEQLLDAGGYDRSLAGEFTMERRGLVTTDDEVVETLLRAVPRRDTAGEVIGTLAMFVDITEREQVKRANERLEEFTRIVSHDLRNPLNVANGRLELAQADCDSEHLEVIERVHDRMDALIENLLTLARDGEQVDAVEPVALRDVTTGCWETVATADATIQIESDRSILADRSRLQQLLENLMRNAVEHGGDDVTVTVEDLPDGFYVEDDGPGIAENKRDNVFEAGYSTAADGTGFGLILTAIIP